MTARDTTAIIDFPAERVRQTPQSNSQASAEVIIFPGVRVERLMYDLAERLPAARAGSGAQTRTTEFDFY
jgi:hypothetical protein